jgi:hypothetical protein
LRKKETYDLQKVTLNLREGDWDRLRDLHTRQGASKIVRDLVIGHLTRVEAEVNQKSHLSRDQIKTEEVE